MITLSPASAAPDGILIGLSASLIFVASNKKEGTAGSPKLQSFPSHSATCYFNFMYLSPASAAATGMLIWSYYSYNLILLANFHTWLASYSHSSSKAGKDNPGGRLPDPAYAQSR